MAKARKIASSSATPSPSGPKGASPGVAKSDFSSMSAWDRYQLASHKDRPRSSDYITALFTEFEEIFGDRNFRDDPAVICGMGRFESRPVVVIAQEMGKEARDRQRRNFGMMHPEGYRKALRVMNLGSRFKMPVIVLIDTKGAYPGTGAEERGQAEAIARNIRDMFKLEVPVIVTVIGAGASGGALGVGLGDRVLMMENSWYNVISPEGCAAILWNDPTKAPEAAQALRLNAEEVLKLGVIDEIVAEPGGGAHMDSAAAFKALREALKKNLKELDGLSLPALIKHRGDKYRCMGVFQEI
ncbi:acetyl-CoA carboxylase carboxyltransferase subunit alpha [soil metagenome]